jgi:hypothetical protein
MTRVSYVIIGPYTIGWRDLPDDRTVTIQRGDQLYHRRVGQLEPGDITRGVNHSRIITGPPVRVLKVRSL